MADAIVVLNAGSSSIKFSLFLARGEDLDLDLRGQIEGIYTAPRFVAKGRDGRQLAEKSWAAGRKLGHSGALRHLVEFLKQELADDTLVGIGHRVVHGGLDYAEPVRIDGDVLASLEKLIPLAPLHQPHNLAPIRTASAMLPDLPQMLLRTAFHHKSRHRAAPRSGRAACRHSALQFHGLSMSTWHRCSLNTMPKPHRAGPSCCISATARACVHWQAARASGARWGSPQWMACRWGLAPGRLIPA
jgi:acetate kinase